MELIGKERALASESLFSEEELIMQNKHFIFDNLHMIKDIQVKNVKQETELEIVKTARESATPGKPFVYFY